MLDKCATLFVISKLATTRKKLLWCTHDIGKTSMHILSSKTELISSICMCWDMIISLFFCLFFLGKSSQKVCLSMLQEKRLQPTFSLRTRLFHLQQVSVRAQEGSHSKVMRSLWLSLSACTLVGEHLSIYLSEGSTGHQEYSQFLHRSNFASNGEKYLDIFSS
jgi:hypothetical protein